MEAMILMIIIICIFSIFFTVIGILLHKTHKKKFNISFKEAMELVELPVVTFYNNNQKLNFLLDTGSNDCIINESNISKLDCIRMSEIKPVFGLEGRSVDCDIYKISINYKDQSFEALFNSVDLSEVFGIIKRESGVQIHGILGSKFFQRYKYVLDFKDLMCYIK